MRGARDPFSNQTWPQANATQMKIYWLGRVKNGRWCPYLGITNEDACRGILTFHSHLDNELEHISSKISMSWHRFLKLKKKTTYEFTLIWLYFFHTLCTYLHFRPCPRNLKQERIWRGYLYVSLWACVPMSDGLSNGFVILMSGVQSAKWQNVRV